MREVIGSGPGCQSGYRSVVLSNYENPLWEVTGSGTNCQSRYRSGAI